MRDLQRRRRRVRRRGARLRRATQHRAHIIDGGKIIIIITFGQVGLASGFRQLDNRLNSGSPAAAHLLCSPLQHFLHHPLRGDKLLERAGRKLDANVEAGQHGGRQLECAVSWAQVGGVRRGASEMAASPGCATVCSVGCTKPNCWTRVSRPWPTREVCLEKCASVNGVGGRRAGLGFK